MKASALAVEQLLRETVDRRFKGFPPAAPPMTLDEIGRQAWSLREGDVPLPLLVIKASALEHNIARMQRYCRENGVELAPHGKTTMCPQIFDRQMVAGAWGMTVATVEQLSVYLEYGFMRLLLANQVAGAANLEAFGSVLKSSGAEVYSFVDSTQGVRDLDSFAARWNLRRPLQVLLEVGRPGLRTGTRDAVDVQRMIAELQRATNVQLAGVATFEGLLSSSDDRRDADVRAMLDDAAIVVDDLRAHNLLPESFIITAGGSSAFDLVVEAIAGRWPGATVILRPGCYVTHDHGLYATTSGLRHDADPLVEALELWAYVQSIPEKGFAYTTFGRRDVPFDSGLPVPIARIARATPSTRTPVSGMVVDSLNDQHARIRYDNEDLEIGDVLIFGISHPCGAFDRWRLLFVIDDDDVIIDGFLTFF